jgi:mono/diheme cytochrome c family protein
MLKPNNSDMKKVILITVLTACIYACTHKTISTTEEQAAAPHEKNPTSAIVSSGRYVYQSKCGSCHGLKNIADYTASQWSGILQVMIPKAKLDDPETQQLVAFIKTQVSD